VPLVASLAIAGVIWALYATRPRVRGGCPAPADKVASSDTGGPLPVRTAATRFLGFTAQEAALIVTFVVAAVIVGLALGEVLTY